MESQRASKEPPQSREYDGTFSVSVAQLDHSIRGQLCSSDGNEI